MADYIDREVLRTYMLAGISLAETFNKDGCLDDKINAYKECLSIVDDEMPSVDAVEVVRCRDCAFNKDGLCDRLRREYQAAVYETVVGDDCYCCWGMKGVINNETC